MAVLPKHDEPKHDEPKHEPVAAATTGAGGISEPEAVPPVLTAAIKISPYIRGTSKGANPVTAACRPIKKMVDLRGLCVKG